MASLSFQKERGREGWRIQFRDKERRKRTLWLGKMAKRDAEKFKSVIEHLISAQAGGTLPDANIAAWIAERGRFRARFAKLGLIEAGHGDSVAIETLGELLAEYDAMRSSLCGRSKLNLGQAIDYLNRHFGAGRKLRLFTPADGLKFREWCLSKGRKIGKAKSGDGIAEATVRKFCQIGRQVFGHAIKRRLVVENPFMGVPTASIANPERQHFIERAIAQRAIDAAPNAEWRAIIALSRFGGLRVPSELTVLRWADVDLANRRLTIRAPKTGIRACPIFPELSPFLEDLAILAKPGLDTSLSERVIASCGDGEKNLRTGFLRILKRAGVAPWPRLFHGMRATRQTELQAKFPAKDVCTWLGNSEKIAMKHYSMATTAAFDLATGLRKNGDSAGDSTSAISAVIEESSFEDSKTQSAHESQRKWGLLMTGNNSEQTLHYPRQDSNL
jgi:integrase